jgi:hypothetical protein
MQGFQTVVEAIVTHLIACARDQLQSFDFFDEWAANFPFFKTTRRADNELHPVKRWCQPT